MDAREIGVALTNKIEIKVGDCLVYTAPADGRLVAGFVTHINGESAILFCGTEGSYCFQQSELAGCEARVIKLVDLVGLFNNLSLKSKGDEQTLKIIREAIISGLNRWQFNSSF